MFDRIDRQHIFMPPCEFGILFDHEIHKYTEMKYNTIIHEMGVIQYDKSKPVCYSADGVGIVNNKIISFEFKCLSALGIGGLRG